MQLTPMTSNFWFKDKKDLKGLNAVEKKQVGHKNWSTMYKWLAEKPLD